MPFLIDGHNLIARTPGLSLDDPDDEARLLSLLRRFCSRRRTSATVYFDAGQPGRPPQATAAGVTARFVRRPDTADAAIGRRLAELGRTAPNWTVVSSDREVLAAARSARARTMASEAFAALLAGPLEQGETAEKPSTPDGEIEIRRWEQIFERARRKGKD